MSVRDTRWHRVRRRLAPVTQRVPYGHLVTESATYARLLAPRALRPGTRFVIFAQGRSGSTLLADLLNSHPRVYCADEILTWRRLAPAAYAGACAVGHRGDVYGFKVKVHHLTDDQRLDDPGAFLRDLVARGWVVLHLTRRNVLRQALSTLVAAQRATYHEPADGRPAPSGPVHVDPGELLARTDQRVAFGEQERRALDGLSPLSFVYEDDLLDASRHQATASRAFAGLGIEDAPVATGLRRIGARPLDRLVANVDEVLAAVADSPYAHMLEQD